MSRVSMNVDIVFFGSSSKRQTVMRLMTWIQTGALPNVPGSPTATKASRHPNAWAMAPPNTAASAPPIGTPIAINEKTAALLLALKRSEIMDTRAGRSEEHTSELQSLMRTSYAVFCLKKKQRITHSLHHYIQKLHVPYS